MIQIKNLQNRMAKLAALVFLCLSSLAVGATYEGYKVYEVFATTEADNEALKIFETNPEFDFWSKLNKIGQPTTIMASPQVQNHFEQYLHAHNIPSKIKILNVQSTIKAEQEYHQKQPQNKIAFDQYQRHNAINDYLSQLAQDYPNLVQVSSIGQSYENRTINLVRISSGGGAKPVLFIEAGMHAREWISPAFALYIINQLIENSQNSGLLDNLDWIVLPVLNPDGYEYTWTTNRMWRKTRSPGLMCDGTDGNRNFGFHWMEQGASSFECSETYAGPRAFSEIEAQNLRDTLESIDNIAAFVSVHSYGQYLFYPYSYDNVVPVNWEELQALALKTSAAIAAVNGTKYRVGASTEVLYPAAGCSDDWAMGGAGIDIVLTFELPGGGGVGFDLPASRILPVSRETWEGIKVIAEYVAENRKVEN